MAASPFTFTPSATPGRAVARRHDRSVGAYAADIARRQHGGRRADLSDDHEVSADRDRREPASPRRTTKPMGWQVPEGAGGGGGGGGAGGAAGTTVARSKTSPGGGGGGSVAATAKTSPGSGGGGSVAATAKAVKGGGSLAQRLEQFREARHRRDRGH